MAYDLLVSTTCLTLQCRCSPNFTSTSATETTQPTIQISRTPALHIQTFKAQNSDFSCHRIPVDGILGILHLLSGPYMILVTKSSKVCTVPSTPSPSLSQSNRRVYLEPSQPATIYQVRDVLILPILTPEHQPVLSHALVLEDAQMLQLLRSLFDPSISPERFFYAHGGLYDITSTYQQQYALLHHRRSVAAADKNKNRNKNINNTPTAPWKHLNQQYWWNAHMTTRFQHDSRCFQWILPIINGYVGTTGVCRMPNASEDHEVELILVARRSRYHQGCRFVCRGVDEKGFAANEVECEQIITPTHRRPGVRSFVQLRGSLPLRWSQPATTLAVPRVQYEKKKSKDSFAAHMNHLEARYKQVSCVNLVSKLRPSESQTRVRSNRGDQVWLGREYERLHLGRRKEKEKKTLDRAEFVWFDFHHECRGNKYEKLSILAHTVRPILYRHGHFVAQGDDSTTGRQQQQQQQQQQMGIVRTNCMDTLDRTNAAQCLFSGIMLLEQLGVHVSNKDNHHTPLHMSLTFREVDGDDDCLSFLLGEDMNSKFRELWIELGDRMSECYANSPALKKHVVRTGKYPRSQKMNDLKFSIMRYISNNFGQGKRQDALDLVLGEFVPNLATYNTSLVVYRSNSRIKWMCCLCYLVGVWVLMFAAAVVGEHSTWIGSALWALGMWLVALVVVVFLVVVKGWGSRWTSSLVDRPCFLVYKT